MSQQTSPHEVRLISKDPKKCLTFISCALVASTVSKVDIPIAHSLDCVRSPTSVIPCSSLCGYTGSPDLLWARSPSRLHVGRVKKRHGGHIWVTSGG